MSTSPISFRRRARRGALALVASASLLPASLAVAQDDTGPVGDRPADYFRVAPESTQAPEPVGDRPADYFRDPPLPVASPHAAEASGVDWTSAGIGAGAAGVLIVVSLAGATAASRLRLRTTRS